MVVLFSTGDQLPVTPLIEVVGKAANVAPEQIGEIGLNVGVILELTEIVIVVLTAH